MSGDDRMADGEAHAHSIGLGAEEGLEQALGHFGREAGTAILDAEPNLMPFDAGFAVIRSRRTGLSAIASIALRTRLKMTC